MFLVLGITGKVGGAAARHLLEQGHAVRALVRDADKAAEWAARGVDIRLGAFGDAAALAEALKGVEGAFLMVPPNFGQGPGFPETKAMIASFRAALGEAPPPRLVVLSSLGSEKSHGLGLITSTHLLEQVLSDMTVPLAFIRAGGFLENFIGSLAPAAATGWLDTFLTIDQRRSMIATTDIGAEAARLLIDGWTGRKIIELGSPFSPNDLAEAMSEMLGRPVRARLIPRDRWAAVIATFGLPSHAATGYEEMEDGINSGWIDFGVPGADSVAGTTPPAQVFAEARKG
jgi:uncharacterized protein YbjT (DUF2867 family)